MQEVKAPSSYPTDGKILLFAAGSIEMGAAEDWQDRLKKALADLDRLIYLNPRRDDWDSTWKQSKDFPQFNEQVTWEIQAQESSDVIAMYFDPNTKSPVTMLELGLFINSKLVVFCPDGFWRKGNVDIVCDRYGVTQATSWDDFVAKIRDALAKAEKDKLENVWK